MENKGIKSPLKYIGGKFFLAPWIIEHFPEHKVYVEPFGGAGHVLCRKDPGISKLEVYNDTCSEIVNLFRVLQDEKKSEVLLMLLELTPHSREWYCDLRDYKYLPTVVSEELKQAYRTLVLMKQSFAGQWMNGTAHWGFNKQPKGSVSKSFFRMPEKLQNLINRIKKVQIDHLDFRECIKRYDSPDTLFYCDPPYYGKEFYYEVGFGEQEHRELAGLLNSIQGKAILSYYDFEFVSEWYPKNKWRIESKNIQKPSHKVEVGGTRARAEELLIMNF